MRTRSTKRATRATSTAEPLFSVERRARNIHRVSTEFASMDDSRWFLLSSDRHHDNPHSDHGLELKHLREAQARGAVVSCIEVDATRSESGRRAMMARSSRSNRSREKPSAFAISFSRAASNGNSPRTSFEEVDSLRFPIRLASSRWLMPRSPRRSRSAAPISWFVGSMFRR